MDFDFTPAPEHHIKFGAEYIHHTFRLGISTSKTQEVENGEQQEETIYAASNNHVLRGQEVSLYAEDNFNLNSHLSLNAGIRASLFSTQGKNYCSIQPRLSTRYNFGQGFSAKASYTCMAQYVHLLSSTPSLCPRIFGYQLPKHTPHVCQSILSWRLLYRSGWLGVLYRGIL